MHSFFSFSKRDAELVLAKAFSIHHGYNGYRTARMDVQLQQF
jgi:hypothetical protein